MENVYWKKNNKSVLLNGSNIVESIYNTWEDSPNYLHDGYIKFDDGTMICYGCLNRPDMDPNTPDIRVNISEVDTHVTFKSTFKTIPLVVVTPYGGMNSTDISKLSFTDLPITTVYLENTEGFRCYCRNLVKLAYIAIGRWK